MYFIVVYNGRDNIINNNHSTQKILINLCISTVVVKFPSKFEEGYIFSNLVSAAKILCK